MSRLAILPLLLVLASSAPLAAGPVKVFILAGQSNMQGHGRVEQGNGGVIGGPGSLLHAVTGNPTKYGHLYGRSSGWTERDDVWIWTTDGSRKGNLTVGFGVNTSNIGPELGFGHVLGDLYEDQVLLIKTCWGGKSLRTDFRPPRRGWNPTYPVNPGDQGYYYQLMIDTVDSVLANIGTHFPDYDESQGYELVGFGWHQGWNDRVCQECVDEYEANLEQFILDIRTGRAGLGVANLPVVVAETGMAGCLEANTRALALMAAQEAPSNPAFYPALAGTVAFVDTQSYWRDSGVSPTTQGYHWNSNGETYYLIGDSMGRAMACLLFDPEVTSVTREASGDVLLTTNMPLTEVVVQRSDNPETGFTDVPFSVVGYSLCVNAANVDPGGQGSAYFRLRERFSNTGDCP